MAWCSVKKEHKDSFTFSLKKLVENMRIKFKWLNAGSNDKSLW